MQQLHHKLVNKKYFKIFSFYVGGGGRLEWWLGGLGMLGSGEKNNPAHR